MAFISVLGIQKQVDLCEFQKSLLCPNPEPPNHQESHSDAKQRVFNNFCCCFQYRVSLYCFGACSVTISVEQAVLQFTELASASPVLKVKTKDQLTL